MTFLSEIFYYVKAFHLVFMVTWFAGLFYLPRLFVYHAQAEDQVGIERFKIMERKLYRGIMTPSVILGFFLGFWLVWMNWQAYLNESWFWIKIVCVVALAIYHLYCGHLVKVFAGDQNQRSHVFFRWFNEIPLVFLVAITLLVLVKPF